MLSGLLSKLTGSASVPAIEHDELVRAHQERSCVIVDVREPHEFKSGHIPGAVNHPLSQFDPASLAKDLAEDKPVVLICQAGGRSATALRRALAAGVEGVRHYAGGMSGWRARGGPVA
ncbi:MULTISPECIES: rhodanese-like domain-containing protein [unclassified Bradyrhizobium]|uniref:rhodanese-like domain-containing protein n=1 Tax=unclassified Bradyrhizobium TaxID=2631580 RepID=UPI0028EC5E2B|nr:MULTISPECIES: rhodanese-like domain-containing protein [unclassified Bradyrhizobium]